MTAPNPLSPVDYSRGPLWWFSVVVPLHGGKCHRTFVRAADSESAALKASRIQRDLRGCGVFDAVVVAPMLSRSGLSRGSHEFAGYLDE